MKKCHELIIFSIMNFLIRRDFQRNGTKTKIFYLSRQLWLKAYLKIFSTSSDSRKLSQKAYQKLKVFS
jgi:hypothetical protein